jgi:hypothetical protein
MTTILEQFLPWAISGFGFFVFWMCAKHPFGWLVGVIQQCLYIPLVIITGEYGFLAHTVLYSIVFVRNYFEGIADHKAPEHEKQRCIDCRKIIKKKVSA